MVLQTRASADLFHRAHHVRLCIGTRVSELVAPIFSDIEKTNRVVNIIVAPGGGLTAGRSRATP